MAAGGDTQVWKFEQDDRSLVGLANDQVRCAFLPELGGRVVELASQATLRNLLATPADVGGRWRSCLYGAEFAASGPGGLDECFPTVAACAVEWPCGRPGEPPCRAHLPDHGELWAQPWDVRLEPGSVTLTAHGVRRPYRFARRATLDGAAVRFAYEVANTGSDPLPWLWATHPLLRVEPGDRIALAPPAGEVRLAWGSDLDLPAPGERVAWPWLDPVSGLDWSVVPPPTCGRAARVFAVAGEGAAGRASGPRALAAVRFARTDESLVIAADPADVPWLGLWLGYGGWPVGPEPGRLAVALGPCTAPSDSLAAALRAGEARVLAPGAVARWTLEWRLARGAGEPLGG